MATPPETPVTRPTLVPTVAMAAALLLHEPPGVASVRVVVAPAHRWVAPAIGATVGTALTVLGKVTYALHPAALVTVYEIVAVPAAIPMISPMDVPEVATNGLLLLHTPPGVASVSVVVAPTHSPAAPLMGAIAGSGFTVSVRVIKAVPQLLETI